jgi:spermidine synthase
MLLLWAVSGFSMLTLETLWMREVALRAGNTVIASTWVIAVFFTFAALGNLMGTRCLNVTRPLLGYARFESSSALATLLLFALGRWMLDAFPSIGGHAALTAIVLAGLPSFLSGAAFPALAQTFVSSATERTTRGGLLYGMNLLGASLGVALGGSLLPWWIGMKGAFWVAAVLQLAGGLLAWHCAVPQAIPTSSFAKPDPSKSCISPWFAWGVLIGSGVFSLAAQTLLIVWARQVLEGSLYAVAGVLTVFIGGLGLGAVVVARLRARGWQPLDLLLFSSAGAALFLFFVPVLGARLCDLHEFLTADAPAGMMLQALSQSALVLLPLTLCLGGVFPVAWELVQSHAAGEGRVLGVAIAANKVGSAAGSVLALFLILPALGLSHGTQVIAWAYFILAASSVLLSRPALLPRLLSFAALLLLGLWQTVHQQPHLGITSDLRLIDSAAGAYGPVMVVEDLTSGSRQILLNTRQRLSGTKAALSSQHHQSWVPLLFVRNPERVVNIGMAAGISAAAALDAPVKELHSIELVPEVVQAARDHFSEWNAALFSDPRSHIHIGDGRQKLAELPGTFDAIICDLLFPAEEGCALLYSREFFESARRRLNPGGIFCLWLPCYQHTPQTAGSIIRTFADAFPHAIAVRANFDPLAPVIGLIGASQPLPLSKSFLTAQLDTSWAKRIATRSPFFQSPDHALLLLVCDLHSAEPNFADFPFITDDHPLLTWLGPRLPRGKERLQGFPFLDWIGKRALNARYPSCDLGSTPAELLLNAIRAGNFYFAASAANTVLPGDPRLEAQRLQQVEGYLQRGRDLAPLSPLAIESLGQ